MWRSGILVGDRTKLSKFAGRIQWETSTEIVSHIGCINNKVQSRHFIDT